MPTPDQELLSAFDGHEVESVRAALEAGADACTPIRGKLPVYWLLEEYTRSDRLGDCLRLLFERGAVLEDVVTTGSAAIPSARALRRAGAVVQDAIVVIDREEGAAEALAAEGLQFWALFRRSQLDL